MAVCTLLAGLPLIGLKEISQSKFRDVMQEKGRVKYFVSSVTTLL